MQRVRLGLLHSSNFLYTYLCYIRDSSDGTDSTEAEGCSDRLCGNTGGRSETKTPTHTSSEAYLGIYVAMKTMYGVTWSS